MNLSAKVGKCQFTHRKHFSRFKAVAVALPDVADEIAEEAIDRIAKPLALQFVPKKTGNLKGTIRKVRVRKGLVKLMAGQMTINGVFVDYEIYVHEGTIYQVGVPFLLAAMNEAGKWLVKEFRNLESRLKRRVR